MNHKAAMPRLLLALVFLAACVPAEAELLKLDLLKRPVPPFTLKLDIFHGGESSNAPAASSPATPAQAEALQRTIAEEIAQSVSYEGFILKNARPLALLNVSGEYFSVGEQETILDKIRILKITREMVTIEYEGQPYEIRIKGDQ